MGNKHRVSCSLISLLIDEMWPHRASSHPSLLQTYTCTFIYFCSVLSPLQLAMARGAHPHPRCVLLGSPVQDFPLLHALISVLSSGNSQLAWLWINGFTQKGCGDTEDRPKGVCFPEPHVSPPPSTFWIGYHSTTTQEALSQGPWLSREFRAVWFIQREWGAPCRSIGGLFLMYVLSQWLCDNGSRS